MESFNKEEIALIQLKASMELFNKENFLPSITLAGAAEELLRQLLKEYSELTGIPIHNAAEIEESMFEFSKDILHVDNYHKERNKTKNELKHYGDARNSDIVRGDFRHDSLKHINGTIMNYKLLRGTFPDDEFIKQFCSKNGIS